MALYPSPFDDIPTHYSFGQLDLEIYVDHYDKSYSFVFPTDDQLVLVEEDEDPVSGGFAIANGVQFHTTISQYEQQWTPSSYLDSDLDYEMSDDLRAGASKHNVQRDRELKVALMIVSNPWKKLAA